MKFKIILTTLILSTFILTGQKKSLSIADFASWNRIENRQISSDGKFVAFEINKQKGDGFLTVYNVKTQKSDTIPHAYQPRFSAGSSFVVFKLRVPEDTLRKHKIAKTGKDKMPKEGFGVYDLHQCKLTKFEKVKSHQLAEEQSNWLAYLQEIKEEKKVSSDTLKSATANTKPVKSAKKKEVFQLTIWEPKTDAKHIFNRVDTFAVAAKGYQTAFITQQRDSSRLRSLVLFNLENQQTDTILSDSLTLTKLTFDEKGNQLAFLGSADTASVKTFALYHYDISTRELTKAVDTLTAGLPAHWSPSVHGNINFSKDGSKLFFGTAAVIKPVKNDSILEEDKPKLDVWSHTDNYIQPRQLKMLGQKKRQTYLAVYRIAEKKMLQLADTTIETVRLYDDRNAETALGTDDRAYQRQTTWSSRYLNDYYLVDVKTGSKTILVQAKNNLDLSPKAGYALYFNFSDSIYYAINTLTRESIALTKDTGVKFYDEENDVPGDPAPYGIAGWTQNDRYVYVYDRYDIWKLDPTGKEAAINLTGGRESSTRYRYIATDDEINFIPEDKYILLTSFNEKTNAAGYVSLFTERPGIIRNLCTGDFYASQLQKAKEADEVIWSTQTVKEFPDVKISNLNFCFPKKISDANPQQQQFNWATVEKVAWTSLAGDSLRGLLYKPEKFDPQRKYPMVVYFYEKSSDTEHSYLYPQPSRSIISIPFYVSNDYLVFVPDIAYSTGYPGRNAYDAIVSGVQMLTETRPYVDEKHMGLQGQSWGGYQIAYLVTRTDMFAAAMAGAPVSNMTSAYGGIRWGTGVSRMFQYEQTQSRIGGTLWDRQLHYLENSPLFMAPGVKTPLLIMHNDNDGAVPWYQGIEFFMALYRLNKPVWLLNYNGMDHNIEAKYWANRIDLSTRMFGFFNHYLKGMPAPAWMTRGVPAVEKGEKLGY